MKSHIYREPIVGILGGMGPAATNYLFGQIIANTIVGKDQDHLHVVINNYPHIPDRTESILGRGNDTFPFLLEGLTLLNNANVDYVLIPCNTAHYFLPKLRKYTNAVIVDMIKLTINYIKLNHPKLRKIGLLATDGVIKTRIYEKYCQSNDLKILTCGKNAQKELMDIIYGINGIKRGFISFELRSRLNIVVKKSPPSRVGAFFTLQTLR